MRRRDFIKYSTWLGLLGACPAWSRLAFAADTFPDLPIPPLLQPDATGRFTLRIAPGQTRWKSQPAHTWGYNGALLGPAVRLQRGQTAQVTLQNQLPESTTVHWHGLEIDGQYDGGPHSLIEPGRQREVTLQIQQPAATCWFHPHPHGRAGSQVARGLAGLVVISDEEEQKLRLPSRWGQDDIPLILQDKRLTETGEIDYKLDVMSAAVGWFGDMLLTNGVVYPRHAAPVGWLRLRLLNGSNARSLRLATSDNRPLYVIASDGGLLAQPVKLSELPMMTAERFEVLVEVRKNEPFDLLTLPVDQMGMTAPPFDQPVPVLRIQPVNVMGSGQLPDHLRTLPALPALDAIPERQLTLSMDPKLDQAGMQLLMQRYGPKAMGMQQGQQSASSSGGGKMGGHQHNMDGMKMDGMKNMPMQKVDIHGANRINGKPFSMTQPLFSVKQHRYEKWIISGEGDEMLHPFHVHGTQFRILSENGQPPAAHRAGFKDVVSVQNARSVILVKFDHLADAKTPYMAHCHLLEHEDTGMMASFTVEA